MPTCATGSFSRPPRNKTAFNLLFAPEEQAIGFLGRMGIGLTFEDRISDLAQTHVLINFRKFSMF